MADSDLKLSTNSDETITCILNLIGRHAQKTPEAESITAPGRISMSYHRLYTHIEATVGVLNALGIGRNDRVAIVLPNGPEMAVSFLAVSACATSAPLNPAYRANEFDFYLNDLSA